MTNDSGGPNITSALRIPSRQICSRPSLTGWHKPAHSSDRSAPDGAMMRFLSGAVYRTRPSVRSATRSWTADAGFGSRQLFSAGDPSRLHGQPATPADLAALEQLVS